MTVGLETDSITVNELHTRTGVVDIDGGGGLKFTQSKQPCDMIT